MRKFPGAEVLPRRDRRAEPRGDERETHRGQRTHEHQAPVRPDVAPQLVVPREVRKRPGGIDVVTRQHRRAGRHRGHEHRFAHQPK